MSWKTTILILALALVTGGLLYIALTNPVKNNQQTVTAPVPPAHTLLSLAEESASTSSRHTVDVLIDTKSNKTTAVQLELSYDPTTITNVSITQGTFFATPTVLFTNIDNQNGRISYALGVQLANGPQQGAGVVAKLVYDIIPGSTGSAKIRFLPKTQVTAEGVVQSVLKQTTDLTIPLTPAVSGK